jgi:MFS family permease
VTETAAEEATPGEPTPEAATAAPRLRTGNFLLLSLYWVAIAYMWQSLGLLIVPDLVQQFVPHAFRGTALSALEGIGTVMAIVWQPVAGSISDHIRTPFGRRRPFILAGTVGDVLFLTGMALSGSYWLLVAFYLLLQTASNTAQGPYQGLLPDNVPKKQHGTASGFYGVANLVGLLAGTVVAGWILVHRGPRAAIASIALLLIVTMVLTVLFVPDRHPPAPSTFKGWDTVIRTFLVPTRYPDFLWLMASRLLILMGIVGMQSFTFFFFGDVFFPHDRHTTRVATYTLLGVVIVVGILVTWPAARLSDRFGRRGLIFAGGLLGALALPILFFSHWQWVPDALLLPVAHALKVTPLAAQTLAAGLLIGVGFGSFISVDWAFITDVIPADEAGLFMGFSNVATAGAGIIARFIGGFLLDAFNRGGSILGLPGGYPVLFGVLFVWLVAGSFLVLKVRESRR